jgi:hypothetical protein
MRYQIEVLINNEWVFKEGSTIDKRRMHRNFWIYTEYYPTRLIDLNRIGPDKTIVQTSKKKRKLFNFSKI